MGERSQPIDKRLYALRSWDSAIPAKFLWTVDFSSRSGTGKMVRIGNHIQDVLQAYGEATKWGLRKNIFDSRTDDQIGFLFAQEVALPQEQVSIGVQPVKNSGGFIAGYYGDRRMDYGQGNKLDITFLEQNKDVLDFFIRPWIVAVSYNGLIEDPEGIDLKCNITVNLHTRTTVTDNFGDITNRRKSYTFRDCVPTMHAPDQISYGDMDPGEINRTVSFVFADYKLTEY